MPPEKRKRQDLLQTWMDNDPELYVGLRITGTAGSDLFCDVCKRIINSSTPSKVKRHVNGHISSQREDSIFFYDLTDAFLAADIPLEKLNHPKLCAFFEKYVDHHIPHPNTLRLRYVDQVYDSVMHNMRKDIVDNFVYFIIDEAADVRGRTVVNFIIGTLREDQSSNGHLIASKVLEKTNPETIVTFVNACFSYVWPDKTNYSNKVLVMLSDATAYMLKAGEILSDEYEYMIHFTCIAQALHNIAEDIRDKFPSVDKLILNIEKVFLKAPARVEMFKKTLPDVPLPPEPSVTRCGTWLHAVAYYNDHFENVKAVMDCFDAQEAKAIRICQEMMNDQNIRKNIRYITSTYGMLVSAITHLETQGLSLSEQFTIINDVKQKINNSTGPFSALIKAKMENLFQRNPGYVILEDICKCVNGSHQELPPSILKYSWCIKNFSYCPLSSVDVERSFLLQKNILQGRRQSFTPENLEKFLVIKFENRSSDTE